MLRNKEQELPKLILEIDALQITVRLLAAQRRSARGDSKAGRCATGRDAVSCCPRQAAIPGCLTPAPKEAQQKTAPRVLLFSSRATADRRTQKEPARKLTLPICTDGVCISLRTLTNNLRHKWGSGGLRGKAIAKVINQFICQVGSWPFGRRRLACRSAERYSASAACFLGLSRSTRARVAANSVVNTYCSCALAKSGSIPIALR